MSHYSTEDFEDYESDDSYDTESLCSNDSYDTESLCSNDSYLSSQTPLIPYTRRK